jgi:hypothetical protein
MLLLKVEPLVPSNTSDTDGCIPMINDREVIERMTRLETELQHIRSEWGQAAPLLKDLHQDMIERKTTNDVLKTASKYLVWLIIGGLSLIGYSKAPALAEWIKEIPK